MREILTLEGFAFRDGKAHERLDDLKSITDEHSKNIEHLKEAHVTPQMFGAIGDGVTDDTLAFKSMLNSAKDGDSVYIPVGTYRITETLIIDKVIYISGEAAFIPFVWESEEGYCGSTILCNGDAFKIARSGVTIQNLTIISENIHQHTGLTILGDSITDDVTFCLNFKNIYLYHFANAIVANCSVFKSCFTNVYSQGCANGFLFMGGGTSLTLTNCWVMWATEIAYYLFKYTYSSFINCCCDNSFSGFKFEGCSGISVIACGCEISQNYSFFVTACQNVTIQNCFAYRCKSSLENLDHGALLTVYDSNNIVVFGCEDREGTEGTDSIVDIRNTNSPMFNNTIRTHAIMGVKKLGFTLNVTEITESEE